MANPTPFPTTSTNASIDKVIFQIERLSGQINELTGNVGSAANTIEARGKETVERLKENFNQDTITEVEKMLEIVSEKTHDWPLKALIVVGITGVIMIIVLFLFLLAKCGEKTAELRQKSRGRLYSQDMESL